MLKLAPLLAEMQSFESRTEGCLRTDKQPDGRKGSSSFLSFDPLKSTWPQYAPIAEVESRTLPRSPDIGNLPSTGDADRAVGFASLHTPLHTGVPFQVPSGRKRLILKDPCFLRKSGRGERIRTSDLTVPNLVNILPVFVSQ